MKTKSVVFDAYGTLFDVNSAAEKCKDKIGDNWESFANFWRTTQLEYTWLRSLMKRHKDSDFVPLAYKAEQSKKVFFCTCKQTNDQPMCAGTHNTK